MATKLAGADEDFQLQDLKLEIDIEESQFVDNPFQITDGVIEVFQVDSMYEDDLDLSTISSKDTNSCDMEKLPEIFLPNITSNLTQQSEANVGSNQRYDKTRRKKLKKPTETVQSHSSAKDQSPKEEKNKCHQCAKIFQSQTHLRRHLQSMKHSPRDLNGNLTQPVAIRALKQFVCQVCEKTFHTLTNLNTHLVRHTASREFRCHHCNGAFKVRADLLKHMIMHFDLMPQSKCQTCGKLFKSPIRLQRHAATHNNVRKFECAHCSSTHKRKSDLKSHLAVHFEELKKYVCPRCSRRMLGVQDFKWHMRAGTCGRPKTKKKDKN